MFQLRTVRLSTPAKQWMGAMALGMFTMLAAAPAAHAQYGRDSEITCESDNGRTRECRTPFRNPVVSQTLSNSPCIEGRTWGNRGGGTVWVTDGCRARFVDARGGGWQQPDRNAGYGSAVVCESDDGRTRECMVPGNSRMVISRQLSNTFCQVGRNWGQRGNRIWVTDGCRAEFVAADGRVNPGRGGFGQGSEIVCESQDRRDNSCNWNARWGRPQLLEQLSDDSCREGYTWGYDNRANRIWVTRGCRGRFGR